MADQLRAPRDEGDRWRAARDGAAATRRSQHADAVVLGEAEPLWPRVIEDLGRGRLDRIYGAPGTPGRPARSTTCGKRRSRGSACSIRRTTTASRSRPRAAARTAASSAPGRDSTGPATARRRSTRSLGEIRAVGEIWERPFLEFADDNLFVDRRWGRELLQRLRPLGARWFAETDISIADDPELVRGPPPVRLLPASDRAGEPLAREPGGDRVNAAGRPAASSTTSTPSARSRTPG